MSATQPAISRAKQLGVFYTPNDLVEALVSWAVRPHTERVLDPSYGDGRFLAAAARRLSKLGVADPPKCIFGAEIDPPVDAADDLGGVPAGQLVAVDFFACSPTTWGGAPFDAIVGNPPYIRHHRLARESKVQARARMKEAGLELSERTDAWAYFCAYLRGFLAPGGRMALVLPAAVLHAAYADPVLRAWASDAGRRVRLVLVRQLLFPGVSERTVVLLVDDGDASGVEYREVADVRELARLVQRPADSGWRRGISAAEDAETSATTRIRTRLRWLVTPEVEHLWDRAAASPSVHRLGDVAQVRIGVVSGANRFFIKNGREAAALGDDSNPPRFVPCVTRSAWLRAPTWDLADQEARREEPSLLMLPPAEGELAPALARAVRAAEADGVHRRSHCRKRTPWYALDDDRAPDLFLPYMSSLAPHLTLNRMEATCTNAIHRVTVLAGTDVGGLAAASWTSLFHLSAELLGRSYGGGVLKLEPNEAAEFLIPAFEGPEEIHSMIGEAYRTYGRDRAIAVADAWILRGYLGMTASEVASLREAVASLRARRAR